MTERLVDCEDCKGEGTVLGRHAGVAGCETPDERCERCSGSGKVWTDREENGDERAD